MNFSLCMITLQILYNIHRLLLAAFHYNENSDRSQASDCSGELQYKVSFPKDKQSGYTVKEIRVTTTYGMSAYT